MSPESLLGLLSLIGLGLAWDTYHAHRWPENRREALPEFAYW